MPAEMAGASGACRSGDARTRAWHRVGIDLASKAAEAASLAKWRHDGHRRRHSPKARNQRGEKRREDHRSKAADEHGIAAGGGNRRGGDRAARPGGEPAEHLNNVACIKSNDNKRACMAISNNM